MTLKKIMTYSRKKLYRECISVVYIKIIADVYKDVITRIKTLGRLTEVFHKDMVTLTINSKFISFHISRG